MRSLAIAGLLIFAIGSIPGSLTSQTTARVTLPNLAIARGTPGQCALSVAAAKGASDTLQLRFTDTAKAGEKLVADLAVYLGVDSLTAIAAGSDTQFVKAFPKGTLETRTVSIKRMDANGFLCSVAPKLGGSVVPLPANVALVVSHDSAYLDSVRNVQKLRGQSFVILSLIKSVSGFIPRDEFFDLRMKFGRSFYTDDVLNAGHTDKTKGSEKAAPQESHGGSGVLFAPFVAVGKAIMDRSFTMASVDIALATRADTSAADSAQRRLADAGFSVNVPTTISSGLAPMRMGYASGLFKIFNTRSYVGLGYGGLEMTGSRLEGSFVQVSYLELLYRDSTDITPTSTSPTQPPKIFQYASKHNVFLEFYVRVPGAQFLDRLRIRGGILLPVGRPPRGVRSPVDSRIVLSVPVVDLDRF